MQFQAPTMTGKITKRYKRFLADIELDNGKEITAHIANTGSMKTCWEPGWPALLTHYPNSDRKLKYSVEMLHNGKTWIGVNTSASNKIVEEALINKQIRGLTSYQNIKREYKVGKSRIDFFLSQSAKYPDYFLEVKNVTLADKNRALFPDAVSERGQKHLIELTLLALQGYRAGIFFLVQREDVDKFYPAKHIDSDYYELLKQAKASGVDIHVYQCQLNKQQIIINKRLPYAL